MAQETPDPPTELCLQEGADAALCKEQAPRSLVHLGAGGCGAAKRRSIRQPELLPRRPRALARRHRPRRPAVGNPVNGVRSPLAIAEAEKAAIDDLAEQGHEGRSRSVDECLSARCAASPCPDAPPRAAAGRRPEGISRARGRPPRRAISVGRGRDPPRPRERANPGHRGAIQRYGVFTRDMITARVAEQEVAPVDHGGCRDLLRALVRCSRRRGGGPRRDGRAERGASPRRRRADPRPRPRRRSARTGQRPPRAP